MLLTQRYSERIAGVISRYDRVVIQDTLPGWCFDGGMTSFLSVNKIRIFDYPQFANALREELRSHAEAIAAENELEIGFIRKIDAFRKDDRIKEILNGRVTHPGLVHILSSRRWSRARATNPGTIKAPATRLLNMIRASACTTTSILLPKFGDIYFHPQPYQALQVSSTYSVVPSN